MNAFVHIPMPGRTCCVAERRSAVRRPSCRPARPHIALGCALALAFVPPLCPAAGTPLPADLARAFPPGRGERVTGFATCSMNRDKARQTVVITSRTQAGGHPLAGNIVVMERRRGRLSAVWRQRGLNPWKLVVGDVDGDGRREIAVGVWKKSPKDPVMAKRTFFYAWNGTRLVPKWLGSKLSRRFDDFTLGDINGDGWVELVALEILPGGRHRIAAYRWFTFGFEWLGCTPGLPGLQRLDQLNGQVVATSRRGRAVVRLSRGKVMLGK